MSVYLLQPIHSFAAVKMLKYIEVVRSLAEQGETDGNMIRLSGPYVVSEGGHRISLTGNYGCGQLSLPLV